MRTTQQVLLLLLFAFAPLCRAETNACTAITALPATISTPGPYCLEQNLTIADGVGNENAIYIHDVADVVLDCNDFRISGVRPTAASAASFGHIGISVGSGSRVTVRNCRVSGFDTGIAVQRSSGTNPRSRDILLEGNIIEGAGIGIYEVSEGNTRVQHNIVNGSLYRGLWVYAAPGQTFVSGNVVTRTGDTVNLAGQAAYLDSGVGGGGWLFAEDNSFVETVGPPGATSPAVGLVPGGPIGISFNGNRILAPANTAEKGGVTTSFDDGGGVGCSANVIVGYGAALPPSCPSPSNKAY